MPRAHGFVLFGKAFERTVVTTRFNSWADVNARNGIYTGSAGIGSPRNIVFFGANTSRKRVRLTHSWHSKGRKALQWQVRPFTPAHVVCHTVCSTQKREPFLISQEVHAACLAAEYH